MKHFTRRAVLVTAVLPAIAPSSALAATVIVNGETDVPGVSYARLSDAVNYVQSTGPGPHTINITTNKTPGADREIFINTPLTIEGDADGDGTACDILVDLTGIRNNPDVGPTNRAYIDVQAVGAVTIRNLRIHPNADSTYTGVNAVNGIQLFKPAQAGDVGVYTLDRVWVSGSDASPEHNFVRLDTSEDLHELPGIKRWSRNVAGLGNNVSDTWAAIVLSDDGGAGTYTATLLNVHAGLSRSTALSILGSGTTVYIKGGLFGHSMRDGIHAEAATVTIQGTPTNRVRVLRVPPEEGKDAHGVEINGANVPLMEYVDAQCQLTGNAFKFTGASGSATLVQYLRALGKFGSGANSTVYVVSGYNLPDVRHSTFVGSGTDYRPIQVPAAATGNAYFTGVIFTSENLGRIAADNADSENGIRSLVNCAIPSDGYSGESLNVTTPLVNNSGAFLPEVVNAVTVSPHFAATRHDYDWSEAAVSLDGSSPEAGNPDVLRPTNPVYATAGPGGTALTGGAGPVISSVLDWSVY